MPAARGLGELVGRLADQRDDVGKRERAGLLVSLAGQLSGSARAAGGRAVVSGRWLTDLLSEQIAPHIPVRDLLTLRQHHGGRSGDALADALITNAARTTALIGAAAGAVAAAEVAAPPALLTAPVMLSAETLAVVAVELKLVAELHVVYGSAPVGTRSEVLVAYLTSWARRRAVPSGSASTRPELASALTSAVRAQLRQRVVRRLGRNLTTLVPFLAGAVAGAELNRRETRALGEALLRDLHRR